MKKTRRLLSLVLAFAIVFTLAVPMTFAADFTDVPSNHRYFDAIQSLVARGIISGMGDGTFAPESTIKRSEFAKMVILSIGMSNVGNTKVTETGFPDVSAEHWAASFIKAAFDQGIINGFEDGSFKPDENVTYDQAIKMVVCAKSGYLKTQAEKNGGYPTGFRKVAGSYGFVKGITDGAYNDPAKRGTIAKLMDNMIKADLGSVLGELPSVESSQMEEVKGQIIAVKGLSLVEGDTDSLSANQMKVHLSNGDEEIFNISRLSVKDDIRSYLGKAVILYYEEDFGVDVQEVSSMSEQRGRNYELTLDIEDIIDYSNTGVEYYDDDEEEQKLAILNNAAIVFNGRLYTEDDFEGLLTSNINNAGSIRFLFSEGEDGSADVIFFTSYENWFVTSVNSGTKTVYGEVNGVPKNMVLDVESKSTAVSIKKDGKASTFSAIKKNQILSVSKSVDGKAIEVLVGPDPVTGSVTTLSRDAKKLTIRSKEYTFAQGVEFGAEITVGANLKIYIDAFNKICKYEFQTTAVSYTYAYLLQMENLGSGMQSDIQMQVLNLNTTSTPKASEYKLADKVTINGKSYTTATDFAEMKALLLETAEYYDAASGDFEFASDKVYQPIKYSTTNGKVSSILIGKMDASVTSADMKVDASYKESGIKCTTRNTTLANVYQLTSSTKVLFVPAAEADRVQAANYVIKSGSSSGFAKDDTYKVILVDVNSSSTPAIVIVYASSVVNTTEWVQNTPMLVTENYIEDGNGYGIELEGTGTSSVYYHDTTMYQDMVSEGDIVRIAVDGEGKIDALEIVAKGADIYAGTKFILPITEQTSARTNIAKAGASKGTSRALVCEGEYYTTDAAEMMLYVGVPYNKTESSMMMILDYPTAGNLTKSELTGMDLLRPLNGISGAKVLAVNYKDGEFKSVETADLGEVASYATESDAISAGVDADKVFVYRNYDNVRLIVVYRTYGSASE